MRCEKKIIRNVLESHFLKLLGQHENLTTAIDSLVVALVVLQDLCRVEMPQTRPPPVESVLAGDVSHEGGEGFNPGIVLLPVEQIDLLLKLLLAHVEWLPSATLIVKESEHVDSNLQQLLDVGDVCDLNRII